MAHALSSSLIRIKGSKIKRGEQRKEPEWKDGRVEDWWSASFHVSIQGVT